MSITSRLTGLAAGIAGSGCANPFVLLARSSRSYCRLEAVGHGGTGSDEDGKW
jgi:hypothetical protein